MNPEECLHEFVRRCEAKAKHSYTTLFSSLLSELTTQVKTKKYNADKIVQIALNISLAFYSLLKVNKLDEELTWLKTEWPKAVKVGQGVTPVSTTLVTTTLVTTTPSLISPSSSSSSSTTTLHSTPSPLSRVTSTLSTLSSTPSTSLLSNNNNSPSPLSLRTTPSLSTTTVTSSPSSSTVVSSLKTHSRISEFTALAVKWGVIKVTDLPTTTSGVYSHTEDDWVTNMQKGAAAGAVVKEGTCTKEKVLEAPEYWLRLGRMVLKSKKGRCFSCAAVASYLLILESAFDGLEVAVWGAGEYDHHFVSIGKSSEYSSGWDGVVVIDVWHGNLNKSAGVFKYSDFPYRLKISGSYKRFCWFSTTDRAKQRGYASKLDGEKD